MSENAAVDADALRAEVRSKYREVAINPHGTYHFHTGRGLAARLGYDDVLVASLPDAAVESFAGVANPFAMRPLVAGERVVDVGAGAGFDTFVAPGRPIGPGDRRRYDRRDARQITIHGGRPRDTACRVSRRASGTSAGRGRLGRCCYQQRRDQSVCRQARGLCRNPPCAAAGWRSAIRGHRERAASAGGGDQQHRSLDSLNRRWSAVCSLAANAGRHRVCRCADRITG